MPNKQDKIRITSYWKAIDDVLGVNPHELREDVRKSYYATKSLLLKESEYLRNNMRIEDSAKSFLTENIELNVKDLKSYIEQRIISFGNKNDKISNILTEASVTNNSKDIKKINLEVLLVGDVINYLSESSNNKIDSLGLNMTRNLIEGYIDTLVELIGI